METFPRDRGEPPRYPIEAGSQTLRESCTNCQNQILPETAARNGGLCGVCQRKRTKRSTKVAALAAMTPDVALEPWLETELDTIEDRLSSDLRRHLAALANDGVGFYGYAILPEDYTTITSDDPPSITVAYNCESDLLEANAGSVYYRYSPDEWQTYVHAGFENTNTALRLLYGKFMNQFYDNLDRPKRNANRGMFFDCLHRTYLNSLLRLRSDFTFAPHVFLLIWIPCSSYAIIGESVRTLNESGVFRIFASEFDV